MVKKRLKLNNWIIAGLSLNALIMVSMFFQELDSSVMIIFLSIAFIPWVLSLLGVFLIGTGARVKLGANLIFYGSIVYVPLGFIAMFGARKILDQLKQIEFEQSAMHG